MTAQVSTLELSHALAIELHGLFRALDLRIQTPELVRDKLRAASQTLDKLLEMEWTLIPEAIAESIERVAELLRSWTPDDVEAWAELKTQLRVAYAGLSSALRTEQVKVPELRPNNYTRSIFHASVATMCLGLVYAISPMQLMWTAAAFAGLAWTLESIRQLSPSCNNLMMMVFRPVAHEQEWHRVNSATWYATALLLLSLTFSPLICVTAVAILGFADPLAGLVGRRWGRIRLVNQRSLEGTLTFIAVGTFTARAAMYLVDTGATAQAQWAIAIVAAFAGGLAELLSRRIDDNLSIPIASAAAAAVLMSLAGISAW